MSDYATHPRYSTVLDPRLFFSIEKLARTLLAAHSPAAYFNVCATHGAEGAVFEKYVEVRDGVDDPKQRYDVSKELYQGLLAAFVPFAARSMVEECFVPLLRHNKLLLLLGETP